MCAHAWYDFTILLECFCEHLTLICELCDGCNNKSAKPKLLLHVVNTHDPCQNAIVRSQRVKFSTDLAHSQRFSPAKYSSNTVYW